MNRIIAINKEQSVAQKSAGMINDKMAVGVIGVVSVLIGCWAIVCLIAGSVASGGPGGLMANLFRALS